MKPRLQVPGYPQTIHTDPLSGAVTSTVKLLLDRGVSFESAAGQLADALQVRLCGDRFGPTPDLGYQGGC